MLQRILKLPEETLDSYDLVAPARSSPRRAPRCPATCAAELDGPVRRQPLQHLRLDRGRLGHDRHARGPARGAGHGRQAAVRHLVRSTTRTARAGPAGRDRPDLRRQRPALRGLHRRRPQGHDRRADVAAATSAASTRTGRLFVEGRDDEMIVSGGENVFPKEVEDCLARHDGVQEAAAIGVDDDDYGKRLGPSWCQGRQGRQRGRPQGPREGRTSPATRCLARSSSSTSCPATRPARCSSGSSRSTTTTALDADATRDDGPGERIGWRPAPDFTLRDQHGRTSRCRRTAGARRCSSSSTRSPSAGSAPASWPAPGPAGRVPDRDDGAARRLLRPDVLPAGVRRRRRAHFPLLSDFWPHGEVARAYGVFDPDRGCPRRSTYIVGRDGRIAWSVHHAMGEPRDVQDYIDVLGGLAERK